MKDWTTITGTLVGTLFGILTAWIFGLVWEHRLLRRLPERILRQLDISVSLQEEFLMTKLLGHKIHADNFKPDVIFAVSPGGLMIAEWLSRRELGNRTNPIPVRAVFVKQERTEKEIQVERAHVENEPDEISKISGESKVLVVIDVARGGQTLGETYKYLRGHFPAENLRTAALFKTKKVRVNYFVTETDKQINFQWKQD